MIFEKVRKVLSKYVDESEIESQSNLEADLGPAFLRRGRDHHRV